MTVKILSGYLKNVIISEKNRGKTIREIAEKYQVSARTIGRVIKERQHLVRGEQKKSPLTEFQKATIYMRFAAGKSKTALAEDYMVSPRTIGRIIEAEKKAHKAVPDTDVGNATMIGSEYFISIVVRGQVITASPTHRNFDAALVALREGDANKVYALLNTREELRIYTRGEVEIVNDKVKYRGVEFHGALTNRILMEMHNGRPFGHLVSFFERLMNNPSEDSRLDLYGFLEHNDIAITEDGKFTAWKYVNEDFTDCFAGKFDNTPGKYVNMPRSEVDPDRNTTCSHGLHVAARSYIGRVSGCGRRVVSVSVDPADVVAVPTDYDNAKMRTCGYQVVEDVSHMFRE